MPKPYVHLIGPPLDVALDARWYGGKGRWVRNGCKPNAVIRPVICRRKEDKGKAKEDDKGKGKEREKEDTTSAQGETEEEETISFALFALKDLRAHDEVVLGWEWDDGNVVHQLPALIGSDAVRVNGKELSNGHRNLPHLKAQMSNILHSLQSTFTTCACGNSSKTCVLRRMQDFVDTPDVEESNLSQASADRPHPHTPAVPGPPPPTQLGYFPSFLQPPPPGTPFSPHPLFPPPFATPAISSPAVDEDANAGPSRPREPPSSIPPTPTFPHPFLLHPSPHSNSPAPQEDKQIWGPKTRLSARQKHPTLNLNLDLGPLVGTKRGFRARERVPGSGGMGGCEMWPGDDPALEDFRKATGKETTPPPTTNGEEAGESGRGKKDLRGLGLDTLDGGYWGLGSRGKGKDKEDEGAEDDLEVTPRARRRTRSQQQQRKKDQDVDMDRPPPKPKSPSPPPLLEDQMPPKMRKARIQREAKALVAQVGADTTKERTDASNGDKMAIDGDGDRILGCVDENQAAREQPKRTQSQLEMPPPPVPNRDAKSTLSTLPSSPPRDLEIPMSTSPPPLPPPPTTSKPSFRPPSPSPATTFAQLSLVSPPPEPRGPAGDSTDLDTTVSQPLELSPHKSPTPPTRHTPSPKPSRPDHALAETVSESTVESTPLDREPSPPAAPLVTMKDSDVEMTMEMELEYLDPTPDPPGTPCSHSPLHEWEPMTRVRPSSSSSSKLEAEAQEEGSTREFKQEMLEREMVVDEVERRSDGDDVEDGEVRDEDVAMGGVENEAEEVTATPPLLGSSPLSSPPPDLGIRNEDVKRDSPDLVPQSSLFSQQTPSPRQRSPPPTVINIETDDEDRDPPPVKIVEPKLLPSTDVVATSNGHKPPPSSDTTPAPSPLIPSTSLQPPQENLTPSLSPQSVSSPLPGSPDAPLKKQKLSLKDFALRRKRMREAEEAAKSGDGNVQASVAVESREEKVKDETSITDGKVPEVPKPAPARNERTKMGLDWLLQPSPPPSTDAKASSGSSPLNIVNVPANSSSTNVSTPPPAPIDTAKATSSSASPAVSSQTSTPNVEQPKKPRITVKEALASIKAPTGPQTPSALTAGPQTPSTSTPTSTTTVLPNPPANMTHKLPPKPSFAPPPSTGNISAVDAITSIANPNILPGAISKAHTHSPTERDRPVTPETPPWERSEEDSRGRENPHPDQANFTFNLSDRSFLTRTHTSNPKWDAWLKRKWKEDQEKLKKQKDVERQREIDDEIDKKRIENDNRYQRQKERERERERTWERERERDDGHADDGPVLRYDEDSSFYRSRSRDLGDRRRDDHRRNQERESAPRRRSLFDNPQESANLTSSKSPSPLPAKKSSTAAFFSPPPPEDPPKLFTSSHSPVVAAPNHSSNPKWSPATLSPATSLSGGITSASMFARAPSTTPAPPPPLPAPTAFTHKSASPAPGGSFTVPTPGVSPAHRSPFMAPTPGMFAMAPPAPSAPPQRPKSPPTQPRSFANPTREPPKGPRALMAQGGAGGPISRSRAGFPSTGPAPIREWDKEKLHPSGIEGSWMNENWRRG